MSGLFGPKANASDVDVYAGIQVSASQLGACVPLGFGRARIPFNLLWYANFVASQGSSPGKGGGGSGNGAWTYTAAFIAGLSAAPLRYIPNVTSGINQIWHDKTIETLITENLTLSIGGARFVGSISGNVLTVTAVSAGAIEIDSTVTLMSRTVGIPQNTTVSSFGTGTGYTGTYILSANCGTVASQAMRCSPPIWSYLTSYTPPVVSITGYISAGPGLTTPGNVLTVTALNGMLLSGQIVAGSGVSGTPAIVSSTAAGGGIGGYYLSGPAQAVGTGSLPNGIALTASAGATGSQALPYDGRSFAATPLYSLGGSAAMPNLNFEPDMLLGYDIAAGMFDADYSAIIPYYLADPIDGAGFQGTIANLQGTTNSFQAYCAANGFFGSPVEATQRQAAQAIQDWMQSTNSDVVLRVGMLDVVPWGDLAISATTPDGTTWNWTPNLTPVFAFDDDSYLEQGDDAPLKLVIKPLSETYNYVNVEYCDRANYYKAAIATAYDGADIDNTYRRVMPTVTLHGITNSQIARATAELIKNASLLERRTYQTKLPAKYLQIEPMDPVSFTDSTMGVEDQVARITEINVSPDWVLDIKALEVTGVTRNVPLYNWNSAQAYFAMYGADPGPVQAPFIFMMPYMPQSGGGGIPIGIAVTGQSDNAAWSGCDVYISVDGGTSYSLLGQVGAKGGARYGVLGNALPLSATQLDTTDTVLVDLANTNDQLDTTVTHADADAAQTLMLIDTGANAEVIAYGSCAASGTAGDYDLSYLLRGLFGSNNVAHASGAKFARLDGAIFEVVVDPGMVADTLYFKFVSFNYAGRSPTETLATVTAYPYTIPSALPIQGNAKLVPRGSCAVIAENVYKAASGATVWDSDCYGATAFTGGCQIIGRLGTPNAGLALGLTTAVGSSPVDPTASGSGYFLVCLTGATWEAFVNGTATGVTTPAVKGDIGQVVYDGFWMRWYVNGNLLYQLAVPGPLALYGDYLMYGAGATLGSCEVTALAAATPSQFIATGECVVNNTNVTKQGGSNGWDSCAYSLTGYPTCHIVGKWDQAAEFAMIGFSAQPQLAGNLSFGSATGIENFLLYNDNGVYACYEGGLAQTLSGAPAAVSASDVVFVSYDGSTVSYEINGNVVRTVSIAGLELFGFVPIYNPGGAVNSLEFGPSPDMTFVETTQLGLNAATLVYEVTQTSIVLAISSPGPGPGTNAITVTIPNLPWAVEVQVTAAGQANINNTSTTTGQLWTFCGSANNSANPFDVTQLNSVDDPFALVGNFSLAANSGPTIAGLTIYTNATTSAPASTGVELATIRVEVIKR